MEHVIIIGDYVITRCKNAFDHKYSYWLSKKGMTVAMYCFSTCTEDGYMSMLDSIDEYIEIFQKRYEKCTLNPLRKPLAYLIYLIEKERDHKMGSHELRRIGLSVSTYEELKEEYRHLEGDL